MRRSSTLKNEKCTCLICYKEGKVGDKFKDTSGIEWPMFYCDPNNNGPHVDDYVIICIDCMVLYYGALSKEYPQWFDKHSFLPSLLEEMENFINGLSTGKLKTSQTIRNQNYLSLYKRQFSAMTVDERKNEATHQTGELLYALCHDPDPRVIILVLQNQYSGLDHARIIAKVHNTSQGLEPIVRNAKLILDNQVQRNLLKNQVLTEAQIRAILNSKTLIQTWNVSTSHDFAQKNRQFARQMVKEKFIRASQENRAKFIFDTEGRILILVHDVPFGDQTVAILCKKNYHSLLLIQNLIKCSRTPAKLLKHLEVQNVVKHNKAVKQLIRRHSNYPKSHLKKKYT